VKVTSDITKSITSGGGHGNKWVKVFSNFQNNSSEENFKFQIPTRERNSC
jgi:hypothetical protein